MEGDKKGTAVAAARQGVSSAGRSSIQSEADEGGKQAFAAETAKLRSRVNQASRSELNSLHSFQDTPLKEDSPGAYSGLVDEPMRVISYDSPSHSKVKLTDQDHPQNNSALVQDSDIGI